MDSHAGEFGAILAAVDDGFPVGELFEAATIAVVIANAATGSIIEVNSAALRLLAATRAGLMGRVWHQVAAERSATGGLPFATTYSTFSVAKAEYLLIRLVPPAAAQAPDSRPADDVFARLDGIDTCFVVTNGALVIEFGNKAFLQLVGHADNGQIAGQSLLRWLSLTQADLSRMRGQMRSREACEVLATRLRGGPGCGSMLEIMAIAAPDDTAPHWGFVMRRAVAH